MADQETGPPTAEEGGPDDRCAWTGADHRTDRDQVLAAIDLPALWVELVGPRRQSGWPCPVPTHAQTGATPPVSIYRDGKRWCCHGRGAGGTAIDLLVIARGLSVGEAFAELRRRAGRPASPSAARVRHAAPYRRLSARLSAHRLPWPPT